MSRTACMEVLWAAQDLKAGKIDETTFVARLDNALAIAECYESDESITGPLKEWLEKAKDLHDPGDAPNRLAEACNRYFEVT